MNFRNSDKSKYTEFNRNCKLKIVRNGLFYDYFSLSWFIREKISMDSGADVNPGIRLTINKGIPLTFNGDMTFSSDGRLYVKGEGKRSVNGLKAACNTNTITQSSSGG